MYLKSNYIDTCKANQQSFLNTSLHRLSDFKNYESYLQSPSKTERKRICMKNEAKIELKVFHKPENVFEFKKVTHRVSAPQKVGQRMRTCKGTLRKSEGGCQGLVAVLRDSLRYSRGKDEDGIGLTVSKRKLH